MIELSDCKINIGLNVLRRRADGYHDIETCMMPVPWSDIIELLPAKGGETTLTTLGRDIDCPAEKNLVMRAYRALESELRQQGRELPPVDIVLQKVVPDGAGLGGGSSDAAHTLTALDRMFGLGLGKERLARIAAGIGADCPVFVYDRPMIAEGIGEVLTPVELPLDGYTLLIAKPEGVSISTRQAYAGITPADDNPPLAELLQLPVAQWQGVVKNDFETSIFALAPQIAQLKQAMLDGGAVYASMSGSGASVYGLFDNDKMAEAMRERVSAMPHFMHRIGS